MTTPSREDIALYMMGEYDGDRSALEAALAEDPAAKALAADEAGLELLLRDAAAAASFCPGCGDLVRGSRCDACGAAVTPGGYVVERVLVSNAHGRMYVAHDADGTQVALKELAFVQSPSLEVIAAFEREAKFLRALEHPAIPRFVASFEEGSGVHVRYYLAQELVTGESLEARLEDHWFTEAEIVGIARQVLEVLVYLQSVSPMVIHRDIKPANLIRRDDGTIAVVDFGAAHVQGTTAGSTSIGTFGYMPIEQLAGLVDATTDVYALGASLVHLLGRREPWRILHGESLDGINVSSALRGFLRTLVAHDPRDRFANAAAALAALDRLGKARVRSWHRPFALAAAAAVAVLASGIGIHAWMAPSSVPVPVMPAVPHEPPPAPERATPAVQDEPKLAVLRIDVPEGLRVELFIDGARIATAQKGTEIPLAAGRRTVKLVGPSGRNCEQRVVLAPGTTTTLACALAAPERNVRIPHADADHPQGRFTADQCMLCHKSNVLRGAR